MTAVFTNARPHTAGNVRALAWIETRRYLRNPVLIAALALTAWTLQPNAPAVTNVDTVIGYPAAFLGGLGLVASFRLTRSLKRCAEIVDVTPLDAQARTLALCLTAVVPFARRGAEPVRVPGRHPVGRQPSVRRVRLGRPGDDPGVTDRHLRGRRPTARRGPGPLGQLRVGRAGRLSGHLRLDPADDHSRCRCAGLTASHDAADVLALRLLPVGGRRWRDGDTGADHPRCSWAGRWPCARSQ